MRPMRLMKPVSPKDMRLMRLIVDLISQNLKPFYETNNSLRGIKLLDFYNLIEV